MFKQFCHRIYKTYSDYELYQFWEQQATRSFIADPGHSYVGRHRFMPASSSDARLPVVEEEEEEEEEEEKMSENRKGKRPKVSGRGKTKTKTKTKTRKNKHIKRR